MQQYLGWKGFALNKIIIIHSIPVLTSSFMRKIYVYVLVVGKDDHLAANPLMALVSIVVVHGFAMHRNVMSCFTFLQININ